MNIVKLEAADRWAHHSRYRENDLFRHWERVLNGCEQYTEIDATSLWKHALSVLQVLKDTPSHREEMVSFLMNEMERVNPIRQVEAVMAIVLTQLANASEEGHTHEPHVNDAMCISILLRYGDEDGFFRWLINKHRQLKVGYDGKKVFIAPHDPMTEEITYGDLSETHQQDVEVKVQPIEQQSEEERVRQAIIAMFEKTYKDSDKPIFSEKCQWRAIYHVLKEKELTDKTQSEFAEWVNSLVDENRVPCTVHSLRKKKGIYYDNEKSRWESEDLGKSGNHMCQLLNRIDNVFRKELEILGL